MEEKTEQFEHENRYLRKFNNALERKLATFNDAEMGRMF